MLAFKKKYLISFVFIFVFVFPRTIYSIISVDSINYLYSALLLSYFIFSFIVKDDIFKRAYRNPLIFTFVFLICGAINFTYTGELNLFRFIGPISAFIGFVFYEKYKLKIDPRVFIIFFLFLFTYYFFTYYANLPSLISRTDFNEDAYVFDNSSSNAIPISLNILLATYILFTLNSSKPIITRTILYLSITNLILIFIQQSRLGMVASAIILIFIINSRVSNKKLLKLFNYPILMVTAFSFKDIFIQIYYNSGLDSIADFQTSVRVLINLKFYSLLSIENFLFGLRETIFFYVGESPQKYTYNIFSEIIRMYGIIPLLFFLIFIFKRILKRKLFVNKFFLLFVFIIYSISEGLFVANLSDTIFYVLLFSPKIKNINLTNEIKYFNKREC